MSKPIKILFTIPNFDTAGSGKVIYDLVKGLDTERFAPEICCFHTSGVYFKTIASLGVPIHVFNFAVPYKPFVSFPFRLLKIVRFFKTHRFDIIHSWHWSSDITEPLAAKLAGIPFVYTKKAMGWGNRGWIWRSKLSTKIIAINQEMEERFFMNIKNKVISIPLGVNLDYFNKSDFVIIAIANLVPVKGIDLLIEAVTQLQEKGIKVLIVGDYNNDYGQQLKQVYENDQIQFLGKQLDVRPFLALADVFVLPTRSIGEGLPVSLLEAMACGKISIGSNVSGINDILSNFSNQLFTNEDNEALQDRLLWIKNLNENEKMKLIIKQHEHIEQYYSLEMFISKHQSLYDRVVNL
jgi:glycosyltransferase involved in cell wall biosynthesis